MSMKPHAGHIGSPVSGDGLNPRFGRAAALVAAAVGVACLLGSGRPAAAHAVLVESKPAAGSTVAGPDVDIKLRFNVRIDRDRSSLTLILPDGKKRTLKILEEKAPDTLSARATDLRPGAYHLRWKVLATDGHITRGDIPFRVKSS